MYNEVLDVVNVVNDSVWSLHTTYETKTNIVSTVCLYSTIKNNTENNAKYQFCCHQIYILKLIATIIIMQP